MMLVVISERNKHCVADVMSSCAHIMHKEHGDLAVAQRKTIHEIDGTLTTFSPFIPAANEVAVV